MGPLDAWRHDARPWRLIRAIRIALIAMALTLPAGCAASGPATTGPPPPPGFPVGVYAKAFQDPVLGRMQINWVFDPSGRWAEVPISLDNHTMEAGVIRGTFIVDGQVVTIASEYPPEIGTSIHRWRVDGNHLWTTFESSNNPDDEEWFAMLDPTPWTLVR